jgi:hypothetical protein
MIAGPDMICFDDDVLPFNGVTDEVGLNLLGQISKDFSKSITPQLPLNHLRRTTL